MTADIPAKPSTSKRRPKRLGFVARIVPHAAVFLWGICFAGLAAAQVPATLVLPNIALKVLPDALASAGPQEQSTGIAKPVSHAAPGDEGATAAGASDEGFTSLLPPPAWNLFAGGASLSFETLDACKAGAAYLLSTTPVRVAMVACIDARDVTVHRRDSKTGIWEHVDPETWVHIEPGRRLRPDLGQE